MKIGMKFVCIMAAAALLAGCGAENTADTRQTSAQDSAIISVSEETVTETKEPVTAEEIHAAMVDRSLYSTGNTARLKAKIEKARQGENVTIAYIGGSITEGLTAGAQQCYAKLSAEQFAQTYGNGDNVNYINAGLSGTPSNLGVLRLKRDVLSYDPDIVFVEFAVNDSQDKIAKESYESLVKTVLDSEGEPAVVLLFNVIESGYTAQEHMKKIGEYYGLPMISAADALTAEFEAGRMTWQDYSDDQSHPNADGHKLLCEFIANMYEAVDNSQPEEYTPPAGQVFGTPYENAEMVTPVLTEGELIAIDDTGSFEPSNGGTSGFTESWRYNGGGDAMTGSVKGSSFFVIYKRDNNEQRGAFDVYIDGKKLKTIDTNQSDGWGEAFSEQVIKFSTVHEMTFEIRPAQGSEDKTIEILGLAAAANEGAF